MDRGQSSSEQGREGDRRPRPGGAPADKEVSVGRTQHRDVIIVGAGLAGLSAAAVLRRRGIRMTVLDWGTDPPAGFRAEKIEPSQAHLLRQFGILELRRPTAPPIRHVIEVGPQGRRSVPVGEQYGFRYGETISRIRDTLAEEVPFHRARVSNIEPGPPPTVTLADGGVLTATVVILATGMHDRCASQLGMDTERNGRDLRSVSFGFDVVREDGRTAAVPAVNGRPASLHGGFEYVTVFPIGEAVRVNVFTVWDPTDEAARRMRRTPLTELRRRVPELEDVTGPLALGGPVQVCPTKYRRLRPQGVDGVVVIGDAFQTVSPATGSGLDRLLTDVDVLCNAHVEGWLERGRADAGAVTAYYRDGRKTTVDDWSRREWEHAHDLVHHPVTAGLRALPWKIRRRLVASDPRQARRFGVPRRRSSSSDRGV